MTFADIHTYTQLLLYINHQKLNINFPVDPWGSLSHAALDQVKLHSHKNRIKHARLSFFAPREDTVGNLLPEMEVTIWSDTSPEHFASKTLNIESLSRPSCALCASHSCPNCSSKSPSSSSSSSSSYYFPPSSSFYIYFLVLLRL